MSTRNASSRSTASTNRWIAIRRLGFWSISTYQAAAEYREYRDPHRRECADSPGRQLTRSTRQLPAGDVSKRPTVTSNVHNVTHLTLGARWRYNDDFGYKY